MAVYTAAAAIISFESDMLAKNTDRAIVGFTVTHGVYLCSERINFILRRWKTGDGAVINY